MATIDRYATAAGQRYRVRYAKPDGLWTQKRGFRTKCDAEAFASTVEVSKLAGSFVPDSAGRVTVGVLAERWLEGKKALKESTWTSLDSAWRSHVREGWGEVPVGTITRASVQQWVASGFPRAC